MICKPRFNPLCDVPPVRMRRVMLEEDSEAVRTCPQCGAALYLADVERTRKVETWECPGNACEFSEESSSPAAR